MDKITQLALMSKAKKVFGKDDTFLSFPLAPLQFTKEELDFVSSLNVKNLEEFSLLVNFIPDGEAWQPTEDRYLWEVYEDILKGMDTEVAFSARTDEEEARYQEATRFLLTKNEAGLSQPSAAQQAYNQFQDQMNALQAKYAAARLTGETTTDPDVKQHWRDVEEPQLRQEISALENRWIREGFKHEVEDALATKKHLGAKRPSTTWEEWHTRFMSSIDTLTGVDQIQFYPSGVSPVNALDEGSWQTFSLTQDEIKALVKEAPDKLKSRLDPDDQDSEVVSITFDFSSAAIVRTWCDPDLFDARFWRFSSEEKQLSDGQSPPSGLCPAYVTGVVFARNISVKSKAKSNSASQPQGRPATGETLKFPAALQVAKLQPTVQLTPRYQRAAINRNQLTLNRPSLSPSHFGVIRHEAPISVRSVEPRTNLVNRLSTQDLSTLRTYSSAIQPRLNVNTVPSDSVAVSKAIERLKDAAVVRPALEQSQPESPAGSSPEHETESITETKTDADQIFVLAFVCKLLPLCPNPDPSLQW